MSNRVKMAIIEAILRLHERRWTGRRIALELGIDRETVARHLALAGESKPAKAPLGSAGEDAQAKPAKAPLGNSESDKPTTDDQEGKNSLRKGSKSKGGAEG